MIDSLLARLPAPLAALWLRFGLVIRYGGVGIINTIFGYGLYVAMIFLGTNLYVAQILSHGAGAIFNYFMFKRHVFVGSSAAIFRYIGAYTWNYLLGLVLLAGFHRIFPSAYLDGFLVLLVLAALNFFVLRHLVFRKIQTPA